MELHDVEKLVAAGESTQLEFKKSTAKLKAAAETLCAFLNNRGGIVFIGVTDQGSIVGQQVSDRTRRDIASVLVKFEPSANIQVDYLNLSDHSGDKKQLIALTAQPDEHARPYTFDGRCFERNESSTNVMPQSKYQQLLLERTMKPISWDDMAALGYTVADLDHDEIQGTLQQGISANRIDASVDPTNTLDGLRRLHLLTAADQPTNAAVVLFCKDVKPGYMQCLLRMARFRGKDKSDFIDSKHVYGNLFHLLNEAQTFIMRNISVASHFIPGQFQRVDEPEYPPLATREALINALCHRDYQANSGSISIAIYADRLEITSPGTLPNGITVDSLKRSHDSKPRNKTIANVIFRRGIIEAFGTGIHQMLTACKTLNLPEPIFYEQNGTFVVCFHAVSSTTRNIQMADLTERQREVVNIVTQAGHIAARDIMHALTKPPAERTLRDDLAKLKALKILNSQGAGRSANWFIATQVIKKQQ